MKRITVEQRTPLILSTLVFTFIFNKIANDILNFAIVSSPSYNPHPLYTYDYSFGVFGIVFVIPGALAGYWLVNRLPQFEYALLYSPVAQKIGVLRWINRLSKLTKVCYRALSIVTIIILKVVKAIWFVLKWMFYILLWILFVLSSMINGKGSSTRSGSGFKGSAPTFNNNHEKLKADAQREAEQLQKDANVAWKHASDQGRYNANTRYFEERLNRAAHKQREADEAARRARDL